MSNFALTPLPALALTALAAIAVSGCTASLDLGDDTTRRIDESTLTVDDVQVVRVTTDNGQVRVVGDDVPDVELRAVLVESDEGDASYEVTTEDGRLTIAGECDGGGWFDQCSVGFDVVVPEDLDVSIETDNGRVEADGVAGTLDIATDNGAIDADDLRAADTTVETDNGRVELSFDTAPSAVDADSDNGAIVVRVPDDGSAYDVDATSDNGAIDIDVPSDPAAGRSIEVDTDNGAIDIEHRSDG